MGWNKFIKLEICDTPSPPTIKFLWKIKTIKNELKKSENFKCDLKLIRMRV